MTYRPREVVRSTIYLTFYFGKQRKDVHVVSLELTLQCHKRRLGEGRVADEAVDGRYFMGCEYDLGPANGLTMDLM